ncbi:MAG: type IV secretion protein DotH [Alphaproteobacteria bacterium CG_4_9_14_3_um_filter_47_13]|nr:MAG: type IV secretion protein DotH [Alphaproteobacteria bacterium CG_4_9_14_3_um_filter_47_13]
MKRRFSGNIFLSVCVAMLLCSGGASAQTALEKLKAATQDPERVRQPSALPAERAQPPRAPGLSLSSDADTNMIDPFAVKDAPAEKSAQEIEALIREESMNAALTGLLPMEPDEIRKLLERFDDTQQAVEIPVYPYPEPEIIAETVSLDPGSVPPVIKVGAGHVTTLTLLDITGAPWPIQDLAYAGNFEVITPEPGGHVIRITGMSEFGYGNVSIRLLELKTPVTFTLKTSRDSVYYRFDARIPEYGPMAQAPLIDGGLTLAAGNSILGQILDGVPPKGAEKFKVGGVDGRTTAYLYQETTYVRTPLSLLSPGWSGSVSSADGMNVYAVVNAPVLLLSDHGQVVHARLSEEDTLDE